jgi:hypothetical protein
LRFFLRRLGLVSLGLGLVAPPSPGAAQDLVEHYEEVDGYLRLGPEPERRIPMTERGFSLVLPAAPVPDVRGVVVFVDARRFDARDARPEPGSFEAVALARNVAVLHVTTGDPLDFLFADADVRRLADRIRVVLADNGLGDAPVFLAGLSLGGTRALRLAEFVAAHPGAVPLRLAATAVVDAPLDMARLWRAERRAADLGFHPAAADEGRWVTYLLETNLGGDPGTAPESYAAYSPYSHDAAGGGNAVHLQDLPVRAYHEPDVDWWIENRRKSYYGMNSLDLAALVNELRVLGNDRAELVTSHGKRDGYAEGTSPHTWSIVDDAELVDWFLAQADSAASGRRNGDDPVDARCAWPGPPTTLRRDGDAVLLEWRFPDAEIYSEKVIPADSAFLAYRAAVRADGAALRQPVADAPEPRDEAEAANWRDEQVNAELALSGEVGTIERIDCLGALLFAFQNTRVPQLVRPTEFVASVLRREAPGGAQLIVVFGAGDEMYPPKSVYGTDVAERYVAEGWRWLYVIHDHTLQRNGDRIALGTPTLSTSDVQLMRGLAADHGLESARVTNGFYTFSVAAGDIGRMRSRGNTGNTP